MDERVSGTIEQVVFHNPDNGFSVLRVHVPGRKELVSVVGHTSRVGAGEYVEAAGAWTRDPKHGVQFKATDLRVMPPHTKEGIEKFLASGLIKGIGASTAKKIVEVFGEKALQVIDESPGFLREIKGMGKRRIEGISKSWVQQRAVRDIIVFLQSHGLGTARAVRIYKTYGDQAVQIIRNNPYRLAEDVWGIGFQIADQLAMRLGIDPNSQHRARAAIEFSLRQISSDGHCAFPETRVLENTAQMTGIGHQVLTQAVASLIQEKKLIRDSKVPGDEAPWLYLRSLYHAETDVAEILHDLTDGVHPLPEVNTEKAIDWVERKMRLQLAPSQREAIRQAMTNKVVVITGGPGVGKTTLMRGLLDIFTYKGLNCVLCAPTGRAAKRLHETTGRDAKTIHRLLEFDPANALFQRGPEKQLELDLLVVDETSMVDITLMSHLLRAVPPSACVVLVGDVDQLPSVGPGAVLRDIIASKSVAVVRLTEIFRQAGESLIVRAAHNVNVGRLPETAPNPDGDFFIIRCEQVGTVIDRILHMVTDRIPSRFGFDPMKDIQVLTPMNRTELGSRHLNEKLQEALNPNQEGPIVERNGWKFRAGDKVLQTVNNYNKDVFNGDIGRIIAVDDKDDEVIVAFDGRQVSYEFSELEELALAYAMTVHKSQGSEYPAVIIPMHTQHYVMLQRNLLYTGITRGKRLVVLVGSPRALAVAVNRQDTRFRYTALCQRLVTVAPE